MHARSRYVLVGVVLDVAAASNQEDEEDPYAAIPPAPDFVPAYEGVDHEVSDGVTVRVRLHKVNGRCQARYVPCVCVHGLLMHIRWCIEFDARSTATG